MRLNCKEVFHYVAEKLRVYPLFENGNKNIKINKERGAVYNDFDFDSNELLSECTSNIAYSQTLVQDASDVFSLNSDKLVPQMSIDHAVLEADRNEELLRQRNNWEGADSVYDAWLLSNNTPRKWFPYQKFISMFPEWETQRLLIYNKENL